MRWVDRGREPNGVASYARQFTQGWINHFVHKTGGRPNDSYWSLFRPELRIRFDAKCGYCERRCDPASDAGDRAERVDHFCPLNRCPDLAYQWTNWIFSCRSCNNDFKRDKWPDTGYVDPCDPDAAERPERYFDCDEETGEIIIRGDLAESQRCKAVKTREDLGLNRGDLQEQRRDSIARFKEDLLSFPTEDRQAFADFMMRPEVEFCGIIRMIVAQLRQASII